MLIDDLIINSLIIIFLYLILFAIHFAIMVYFSTKKNQIGLDKKFVAQDLPSNLIVIVYANSFDNNVVELAKSLILQKYPRENYQIHFLFDNVTDETPDLVDNIGGIKVWRINKGSLMGKDEALSWLLEKLISFRNVNAFVFLDANRKINENFLSNINVSLFSNDIVVPALEYVVVKGDMIANIKNQVLKYYNRIINTTRAVLNLMNPIDSGAVAIKQEVLELIRCVDFKDKKTDYLYSIFLANKGYLPIFAPDVVTKIEHTQDEKLSIKDKLSILRYGFSKIADSNFKVFEFLLSFFKPSAILVIFLYIGFFAFLYNFEVKNMFFYDIRFVLSAAIITFGTFIASLFIAKDNKINPCLLLISPIYMILGFIFPNKIRKEKDNLEETEKTNPVLLNGTNVKVTDGNNILNCSVEIKNTGNGMSAIFRYKSKYLESNCYESPKQAINEISEKLRENGLKLHVCSVCAHFGFKPDSDISSQTGLCSQKDKMTGDIQPEVALLDSCEHFNLLAELNNVVDFKHNNLENTDN